LAALTGRALTILRAGFALKTVGSFVNGLMPSRAFVAGFFTTINLASPGTTNAPLMLSLPGAPSAPCHLSALQLLARHPGGCAETVLLQLGVLVFNGLATMQPSVTHDGGRERRWSG
jgi:hypothetical protein